MSGSNSSAPSAPAEALSFAVHSLPAPELPEARRTRLGRLFQSLENAASMVAPAAQTQADLFVNLDTTFSALSAVRGAARPRA